MNTLQSIWNGLDWSYLLNIVLSVVPSLLCITFHEVSHGYVAYRLGDTTAKDAGRLTLNPLKHIDPMGLLMMVVFKFGWAKPVPVNPYYFTKIRNRKAGIALTALAGPVSNLLMALVAMLIAKGLLLLPVSGTAVSFLFTIFLVVCQTNLGLAVFNLIPIHPLDGSRVLEYFLPARAVDWIEEHEQVIYVVFMVVILFTPILDRPLSIASSWMYSLLNWLTSLVVGF